MIPVRTMLETSKYLNIFTSSLLSFVNCIGNPYLPYVLCNVTNMDITNTKLKKDARNINTNNITIGSSFLGEVIMSKFNNPYMM